jgi:hypothetical protein
MAGFCFASSSESAAISNSAISKYYLISPTISIQVSSFIHSFIVIFHQYHQGYKIRLMNIEPVTVAIYTCFTKKSIGQINNNQTTYLI